MAKRSLYRAVHGFHSASTGFSYLKGDIYYLDDDFAQGHVDEGVLVKLDELPLPDVKDSAGNVILWPQPDAPKPKGRGKGKEKAAESTKADKE